jgi:two-component system, NtrC family, sensor kinase
VADSIRESDRRVLAAGTACESELVLPEDDGPHTYLTVKSPLYDEDGKPYAVCGVSTDITQRKRAEDELKLYKEDLERLVLRRTEELTRANQSLKNVNRQLELAHTQLLRSEKLASIGQLAAGVAHEINNPVASVASNLFSLEGYLDQLTNMLRAYAACDEVLPQDRLAAVDAAKRDADFEFILKDVTALMADVSEGVHRVKRIVDTLLRFSHRSEGAWQVAHLRPGLEATLRLLRHELERQATVLCEFGEMPPVECVPAELNQVFMNLLANAAQAIRGRGTIHVRTGGTDGEAWVEIQDSGEGIARENLKRIFDPFFTTKPVGEGTGLGLAVSYRIVESHHGRIEVESEQGAGSRFRVWVPVRQPAAEA